MLQKPARAPAGALPPVVLPILPVWALVLCGAACGAGKQTSMDAGADYIPLDAPAMSDVSQKPLALDFSATGCAKFDPAGPRCDGTAPLALTFTPIGSEALVQFLWDFGDGTVASSDRSPTHVFALPDLFTVTLVAGGGPGVGTVPRSHANYVNVTAAPAGARCDVDLQCADDLSCWCGSSNPCAPALSRGLCGRPCDAAAGGPTLCPDDTVCSDLSIGAASPVPMIPTPETSWRRSLCLPACVDDGNCSVGFRCRDLLAATPAGAWIRACFATYPLAIGMRCGDEMGNPVDDDCASRLCADLGAFGSCSFDCSMGECPRGTACAQFGDGRKLCLATCQGASPCGDDPLLACEPPGGAGALGFAVSGSPGLPAATYCAPKRCVTSADCGPAGTCPTGGGNCKRLPRP